MIPGPLVPGVLPVAPAPVPVLAAGVTPRASRAFNHVAGSVEGTRTAYADLNACAWFTGGGWDLRGGRRLRPRGLSGTEDREERRR
ncbi:hypothetical protein [Deinococcus sp. RIT780]|uniref:hypothetical protein n=1 Tax=Deinococcus sp. RIT780 TaxID=2870472 RepID=UPI001C8A30CB|nr:hypothetical protein [Deinococcus sp. RIT780]MBX8464228.1 hypothetical protein [Deinococcus sp. RIT780]